jgi:CRISPR-associated protein Cmr3
MTGLSLLIEPLDVLFFRDGRPFEATDTAVSTVPRPQTVAAAIRSFLLERVGVDFDRFARDITAGATVSEAAASQSTEARSIFSMAFKGPWFCNAARRSERRHFVPVPADLHVTSEGKVVRLLPMLKPPPGWKPLEPGMLPLWHKGSARTKRAEGYIDLAALKIYLAGGAPDARELISEGDMYLRDRRTGISVDAETGSAKEGLIYGIDLLTLKQGMALYIELDAAANSVCDIFNATQVLSMGGEGHRVRVTAVEKANWPRTVQVPSGRRAAVLTSPGIFDTGWRPSGLKPLAAAVPGAIAVSGWDMARGTPKPNRFAAAAGSVYYLDGPAPDTGVPGSLCSGEDGLSGWGTYVEGVWKDE